MLLYGALVLFAILVILIAGASKFTLDLAADRGRHPWLWCAAVVTASMAGFFVGPWGLTAYSRGWGALLLATITPMAGAVVAGGAVVVALAVMPATPPRLRGSSWSGQLFGLERDFQCQLSVADGRIRIEPIEPRDEADVHVIDRDRLISAVADGESLRLRWTQPDGAARKCRFLMSGGDTRQQRIRSSVALEDRIRTELA